MAKHRHESRDPKSKHRGRLHSMAVRWLMDRANPEEDGGLGVFADTRFCMDLTRLLKRVRQQTLAEAKGS